MKFTHVMLGALVTAGVIVIPAGNKGIPSSRTPCHSSFFLPLDPLTAVETSTRTVMSNPLSSEAHRKVGCANLALFDSSEVAQREFREAVRLDPSSSAGYAGFGWSYLDLNSAAMSLSLKRHKSDRDVERYWLALDMFEVALRLDPDDASAHLGRAQAFYFLGRNEDAEAACRAALASCPSSGETWDLLGDVLVKLGRYSEAIDAYKAEIEISSTTGTTLESLSPRNNRGRFDARFLYLLVGDILFTLHRTTEAIAQYERGVTISEDFSPFHHRLALAYYQLGEYEKHESHLEALRVGCSSTGDVADWCHSYEDLVYRLSEYQNNRDMLFRVTNLDSKVR